MIINSSFRAPKGLGAHILTGEANDRIVVRDDLSVGSSLDVADDIESYAALGHARGIKKSLVHFSISPGAPLTEEQLVATIAKIRAVYGVSDDQAMVCVQHSKPGAHSRPDHYHLVMPRFDMAAGKCISDSNSWVKNERISRELEADFAHEITIGRHNRAVRIALDVARPDMAALIDPDARPQDNASIPRTVADKQQSAIKTAPLDAFDRAVLDAWIAAAGDATKITGLLASRGIAIAAGEKAVMAVDLESGFSGALGRVVNREAKRRDLKIQIKNVEVARLFSHRKLKPLAATVEAGLRKSLRRSKSAVFLESIIEAHLAPMIATPEKPESEKSPPATARPSQAAMRSQIIRNFDAAKRKRRRNVELAWSRTRLFSRRETRKLLGFAIAGVALSAGAPVLLALGAGYAMNIALIIRRGVAVRRARALTEGAKSADRDDRAAMAAELARYRSARAFDLNTIPKPLRVVAGALFASMGAEPHSAQASSPDIRAWRSALEAGAPGLADRIVEQYECGSGRLHAILTSMFDPRNPAHRDALAAALQPPLSGPPGPPLGPRMGVRSPSRTPSRPARAADRGYER